MSQVHLAEHRGSTNWGDRKSNQHKSSQIKCWFLLRGENWSTQGKTSRSRVENQQTQPTYDVRSGNRTRATLVEGQCSHHCANTAPKYAPFIINKITKMSLHYFCFIPSKQSNEGLV